MKRIRVGKADELTPGGSKAVSAGDGEIGVFNADGSFYAVDNACPHRGGPLSEGRLEGCVVVCPWHGWQFDVTDGSLLMNPASKLKTYKVVREGDDLYVEI